MKGGVSSPRQTLAWVFIQVSFLIVKYLLSIYIYIFLFMDYSNLAYLCWLFLWKMILSFQWYQSEFWSFLWQYFTDLIWIGCWPHPFIQRFSKFSCLWPIQALGNIKLRSCWITLCCKSRNSYCWNTKRGVNQYLYYLKL